MVKCHQIAYNYKSVQRPLDFKSIVACLFSIYRITCATNSSSFNIDNIIADYRITNRALRRPSCARVYRTTQRTRLKPVILFNIHTAIIVAAVAQFATSFCNIALYYTCIVARIYTEYMDVLQIFRLYRCRAAAQSTINNMIVRILRTRQYCVCKCKNCPCRYTDATGAPIAPLLSC